MNIDFPHLSNEDLVLNAEAIFLELDKQESDGYAALNCLMGNFKELPPICP
jgi:hypothetical protein